MKMESAGLILSGVHKHHDDGRSVRVFLPDADATGTMTQALITTTEVMEKVGLSCSLLINRDSQRPLNFKISSDDLDGVLNTVIQAAGGIAA